MRQLFLKIFVSVLLTVLLTFAGGFAIGMWLMPKPDETRSGDFGSGPREQAQQSPELWRSRMVDVLSSHARAVSETLASRGPAAALESADSLNVVWGVHTYLVAVEPGKDVRGRELPAEVRALAESASAHNGVQIANAGDSVAVALAMQALDGIDYVFVAETSGMPQPPIPPSLAWMITLRLIPIAVGLGLVCFILARYITDPVLKLRAALRRFGEGDLAQRVGATVGTRRDEIGELARDFDHMAERIATLLDAQRRLLRDISHELRSPLARQRVALQLARQQAGAQGLPALDRVELEAERLDELIGELLTLARLENDAENTGGDPVDLSSLVREVIENAEFEARNGSRSVRLVAGAPCAVRGVPELLRRAVENVVRNAVAYTKEQTNVEVSLAQDAHNVIIRVRDHGPGVPADQLPDIFRPFYRVSQARDRQTGGVGLGLAIAERAVRLHGGSMSASNHECGGLVVEIRLPYTNQGEALVSAVRERSSSAVLDIA